MLKKVKAIAFALAPISRRQCDRQGLEIGEPMRKLFVIVLTLSISLVMVACSTSSESSSASSAVASASASDDAVAAANAIATKWLPELRTKVNLFNSEYANRIRQSDLSWFEGLGADFNELVNEMPKYTGTDSEVQAMYNNYAKYARGLADMSFKCDLITACTATGDRETANKVLDEVMAIQNEIQPCYQSANQTLDKILGKSKK